MTQQIMSLKPVLKESLHRKIADAIIDYINTSGLKAGEKLQQKLIARGTSCTGK